jgi:hypothetical protein
MAGQVVVRGRRRRRWPARVAGLLGTAALLGSGVAIAYMVMPSEGEEAVVPSAPAATPEHGNKKNKKPRRHELTRAEKRIRAAAVATLTAQGYEPVRLADYDIRDELRVLIGRPAIDDAGDRRAFFFVRREYIGHDSDSASASLRVVRSGERTVTLSYGLYDPGDQRCCPHGGHARVRFRLKGGTLSPQGEIPALAERVPAS